MNGKRLPVVVGIVSVLWLAVSSAVAQGPVRIRLPDRMSVTGADFRLGDVARIEAADPELARRLSGVSLGACPKPGKSRFIDPGFLRMRIGQEGFSLESIQLETPERIEVVRTAREVGREEVREAVAAFFKNHRSLDRTDARVLDFKLLGKVVLPVGPYTLDIETPHGNRMSGTFPINLTFQSEDGFIQKVRATVKLEMLTQVVMAERPIPNGQAVTAADLGMVTADLSTIPAHAVTDPATLVGKRLKRHVAPRTILRTDLVEAPPLVTKGDIVTIFAESGALRVTALGEAREDGRAGDQIRVTNLDSKKELHVRVVDNQTVKVLF